MREKDSVDFVIIWQPLITRDIINDIVERYTSDIPSNYDIFFRMFGCHKKRVERKGIHLSSIQRTTIN